MIGELVPLVMIPRYTGYVAPDVYATVPLNVEDYVSAALTFWRGSLVGSAGASFSATFQESHDAQTWVLCTVSPSGQIGPNGIGLYKVTLKRRWFRMRIALTADVVDNVAAISCWAVGSLQRRIPGAAG